MPDIEENLRAWDRKYEWEDGGAEWSGGYGGVESQWNGAILPRILPFVPAARLLEIAPGFGRWTHYLVHQAEEFIGVDLSKKCVEQCRERFSDVPHASFQVNDGKSFPEIADGSIDFVFSYDSLVHAELDVLTAYLREFKRILAPNGTAFIHHSNLAAYPGLIRLYRCLPRGQRRLTRWGLLENSGWRAPSVSAGAVRDAAADIGLICRSQELITWGGGRRMIDCHSVFTQPGSRFDEDLGVIRNPHSTGEMQSLRARSTVYRPPHP